MKKFISIIILATAFISCSNNNDEESDSFQSVYYGSFISTIPNAQTTTDQYYTTVDINPYVVEHVKDTLKFEGLTEKTKQTYFTLTLKGNSSNLDVIEKFDGDSIFSWYAKERAIYKEGKYTSDNGVYEIEVTSNGIYINIVGASEEYRRLYKELDNYAEIRYTKTGKSESRTVNDCVLSIPCNNNSLHFVGNDREYKAIINGNTCILNELSPEEDSFELNKIK